MDSKLYAKEYYQQNKERMLKQISEAKKLRKQTDQYYNDQRAKLVIALNTIEYKRLPFSKMIYYAIEKREGKHA